MYKNGLLHIVKLLKLVFVFAIGVVPIHDVATREKRLFGCERCIILDRIPKYSTTQSLHMYNPFKQDAEISRN